MLQSFSREKQSSFASSKRRTRGRARNAFARVFSPASRLGFVRRLKSTEQFPLCPAECRTWWPPSSLCFATLSFPPFRRSFPDSSPSRHAGISNGAKRGNFDRSIALARLRLGDALPESEASIDARREDGTYLLTRVSVLLRFRKTKRERKGNM